MDNIFDFSPSLKIEEQDGSPSGYPIIFKVDNGLLTDDGGGVFSFSLSDFLLLDGSRSMTGDLDLGNNDLLNPGAGHDSFTDFVANEHIDWTNATNDFLTTGDMTVDSPTFFVDASQNNVGIGTVTPDSNPVLHIVWPTNPSAGTDPSWVPNDFILIESGATGVIQLFTPNNMAFYLGWSDPETRVAGALGYLHSSNTMDFWANGAKRMTLSGSLLKSLEPMEIEHNGRWSGIF